MFKSNTGEKMIPRIENKIISRIETFDNLPRSTKYFAAGIGSLCTAVVTETVPNPAAVPFICVAVAVGYFGVATRTFIEDNPTINPED